MDIQNGVRVDWTDEQDQDFFEEYVALTEKFGPVEAVERMQRIRERNGLGFTDTDLTAWVQRYVDEYTSGCAWDDQCENEATTVQPHPVLISVPICERCKGEA